MEKEARPNSPEIIKRELVTELKKLKTNYKDGIPKKIINSTSPDSGYKVQKFWFQDVVGRLNNVIRKQFEIPTITLELIEEITNYTEKISNPKNGFTEKLTTQEDIDEAEAMIDKVVSFLEK